MLALSADSTRAAKTRAGRGPGAVACVIAWLFAIGIPSISRAADGADVDFEKQIVPLLETYCTSCHGADEPEGGLNLLKAKSVTDVKTDREHWEKVFAFVRIQAMPPADSDQPTEAERELLLKWLDHTLFYVDCEKDPNPGRVTVRRLNRTEYNNTVRDLVGVKFQPADDFPSDDVGYGFDNIGDVLSISPLLMEKYLDAAEQIAGKAIAAPEEVGIREQRTASKLKREGSAKDGNDDTIVMPSTGSVWAEFELPLAGEYLVRIEAAADQAGDEPAKMRVDLGDGELVTHSIKEDGKSNWYETKFTASAGSHRLSAAFINDFYDATLKRRNDRNLYVRVIEVQGPLSLDEESITPFHREFLKFKPGDKRGQRKMSATDAATANIRPLLARAFRRPVNTAEVSNFTRFVRLATDRGDSFEKGMQVALQAILVAPEFLFRIEQDPDEKGADTYELDQFELASRLSYFLWSSMPDDELMQLAGQGRLADEGVIVKQIDRMLADPRSQALVENFAGQWLGLRKLHTAEISPNRDLFPDWNEKLRGDIEQETLQFFGHIVKENRNVLELLDARYSFVNERLAKLYGIDGVEGDEFRKVDLPAGQRAGLLTQASILTLTSYSERTSPVLRGEWVLSNLLGDEPPPPPPTVPGLDVTQKSNPDASLREQLQLHRSDPGCASCHRVMDAIGFGLENFDAIGRWRDKDGKHAIDATGELPTGETFRTPEELIAILRSREKEFARCLSEKLLTYALGRGLEYYDRCAVDKIVNVTAADKYRFHTLVKAIATSRPFLLRAGE